MMLLAGEFQIALMVFLIIAAIGAIHSIKPSVWRGGAGNGGRIAAAGVAAGGTSIEDPPGWREGGGAKLYLAYLRDPAGNKICALHRG